MKDQNKRYVLGVSGASGMVYALRLAEILAAHGELHLIVSRPAQKVLALETDTTLSELTARAHHWYDQDKIEAGPASGTWLHNGMVVCPCSMASIAAIAHGFGDNLLLRAADATLKEGRKLILVPRETPLSSIHLQNLLTLSRANAAILPACPGFYHKPASLEDIVDQVVGKILDQLGLDHTLTPPWQ